MSDAAGLDEAYGLDKGIYTQGSTMYVAGTKSLGDVADDLSIPLGMTNTTQRYRDASLVLDKNPQIQRVVGHSLGGAVALQLQKVRPELQSETYGAPVISASASNQRHRHWLDPIAALDFGADTSVPDQLNPHSYQRLAARRKITRGPSRMVA